ncbi:hypothetical protein P691DRAFT_772325 [Macrolepiota fuliginosa MF-IS2]|uniref:Uncharacterized protein n=1 Tax=Macrolepiota fuliginosa MF-IS2 TaxID=1400762 RepID=A0A9P5XML4_9AGAR|nr:hypothetical protein P691DRAFT_772325 [Macrolepiota fuliginosa MF-IS2]
MSIRQFLLCASLVLLSLAQTQTIVDPAGNSVVVVATTDAAGAPLTQTISTLPPAGQPTATPPGTPPQAPANPTTATTTTPAAATTATTATTPAAPAAPPAQGPVGQPDPTPGAAGGVTPFTYTTVVNGVTTAIADNFTPTNPATTPVTPTGTGTVWDYSQWLSSFGGPQATAAAQNGAYRNYVSDCLVLMTSLFAIHCALLL